MGGDEFAAVIPRATPLLVQSVADELCTAVREQPHAVGSSRVHATVSIGGVFLAPRTTLHEALAAADTVLSEVRTAGSDRAIVLEPSQDA
jgi:diguanylate cyclase